jgi:hypothetical protein
MSRFGAARLPAAYDRAVMFMRCILAASAIAAWSLAWGQATAPPERLMRVSHVEGEAALKSDGRRASDARPNDQLKAGDRVVTPHGARAELLLDASPIRLNQRSELRVDALEAMHVQLGLERGVAYLHIRELYEGEQFEIALANVRLTLLQPGEYRLEARESDFSVLTVASGAVDVATAGGLVRVASGQRVMLEGRDARATLVPPVSADAFDDWVLEREVQLASAEVPGPDDSAYYAEAGRWYDDATYGHYWMADSSYGYAPWSFFYFSSGRWGFHVGQGRWCWNPPRPSQGPVVAQETHPFGRARSVSRGGGMSDSLSSGAGTRSSGRSRAFGGSSGSSGSMSGGSTHSMRGSASYGRSRSPSSGSSSVFGVPTSP